MKFASVYQGYRELLEGNPKAASLDATMLRIAVAIAQLSKDPKTKVGAVGIDKDRAPLGFAYNGFIAGAVESFHDEAKRDAQVLHAEENLLNYIPPGPKRDGGWSCYITRYPCDRCFRLLAAAKVTRVVYIDYPDIHVRPSATDRMRKNLQLNHTLPHLVQLVGVSESCIVD